MATEFTTVPSQCDWGAFTPQVTYATPLKDLTAFVNAVLKPFSIQSATVELQVIVFEPRELIAYCATQGIQTDEAGLNDKMLSAKTKESTAELLEATLGDWIDFFFVPEPSSFVIFADHDEYTTFFTRREADLQALCESLDSGGFKKINGWNRDPLEDLRKKYV
jgi:hypothetical protein